MSATKMIEWRLRVVMAERNITPSKLASITGISRVSISRLKNAKRLPRINELTLDKLCDALRCQPGDLMRHVRKGVVDEHSNNH